MKLRIVAFTLCIAVVMGNVSTLNAENVSETLYGINNAQEIINNIDFNDVNSLSSNYWAKDAIYEMASLSVIKGYGAKQFKPQNNITKGEALALIYKALGKEAVAQLEGDTRQSNKMMPDSNIKNVWAEGFLVLAQKDGLITQEEFDQGVNPQGTTYYNSSQFNINDPVRRQDVATWIAKAFGIKPIYNQINIFNNYKDWQKIDYANLPYVEALLTEKIMNGDDGYFYPNNILKRDEITQVLLNLEDKILEINGLKKKYGYVENIDISFQNNLSSDITGKTILVRSEDGALNSILLQSEIKNINEKTQEIGDHGTIVDQKEVIVNKDGKLGQSSLLKENDQVFIIYDSNNSVKFIQAKANNSSEKKYFATVKSVDLVGNKLTFKDNKSVTQTLGVSNGVIVSIDNESKSLSDILTDTKGYITVKNNLITRINIYTQADNLIESKTNLNESDIRGIIKEINKNLNYLTLYGPFGQKGDSYIRTVNFHPNVKVTQDGQSASVADIEIGDTVYIKFDINKNIELINVKKNYYNTNATVQYIGKDFIITKFDDGSTQYFTWLNNILIYKYDDLVEKKELMVGDRVRLTLNRNDESAIIKSINIEPEQYKVQNIYKGKVYSLDNELVLYDTNILQKSEWSINNIKGFTKLKLDNMAKLYSNREELELNKAKETFLNNEVYVTTYKDYQNDERVIKITQSNGAELLYSDKINRNSKVNKSLELETGYDKINYDNQTIVTRYGRIVDGNNIEINDSAYIVGVRNPKDKTILASIIQIIDKPSTSLVDIYRGKISSIDEGKSFTVSSFSKLKEYSWEFTNTPKTFELSTDTEILSTSGLINNRDFIDYTDINYKDINVYIVADSSKAEIISDGIYGVYNLRGEIYAISDITGSTTATINLLDVAVLNSSTNVWTSFDEGEVDILENSIIIKDNKVVQANELKVRDKIRVIKKDITSSGDGLIILVEE